MDGSPAQAASTKKPEWAHVSRWPSGFRFPGGESFAEVAARAIDTARLALADAHRGETFVAVSHADPIKLVVATAAGVPLDLFQRLVDLALLDLGHRLRPDGPPWCCA